MIWQAVCPTLTVLDLLLGDCVDAPAPVVRTGVLVTIAVPIVSYGLMPQLHRIRRLLLTRSHKSPNLDATISPSQDLEPTRRITNPGLLHPVANRT
jgi:antibiotic biosynthesis monooxygenase (ABM) superfamily enzyme